MSASSFAILLSTLLFSTCTFAITPADVAQITDATGARWYRFNGKRHDQSPTAVTMHIENGQVEVESSIRPMRLHALGANAKQLWKIDKQGRGEVVFENLPYPFNAEESEDAKYVDTNGPQANISH